MAYKLSQRHLQDNISARRNNPDTISWGIVAGIFIIFGLLSFLTAAIYSADKGTIVEQSFRTGNNASVDIGPFTVKKPKTVYKIKVQANLPVQTWSFVEGQVLDNNKEHLFSFGKELWHEKGYSPEGNWQEKDNKYSMHVTIPNPGKYYLRLTTQNNAFPLETSIKVTERRGSSIPHLLFGVVCTAIGLFLNEFKNITTPGRNTSRYGNIIKDIQTMDVKELLIVIAFIVIIILQAII